MFLKKRDHQFYRWDFKREIQSETFNIHKIQ